MMSRKERERLRMCARIKDGEVNLSEGSNQLELSYRQMLRVYDRFQEEGEGGEEERDVSGSSCEGVKACRDLRH